MGGNIHLTTGGGVLKAENANCERRVEPVHYIFHTGIVDLHSTQHKAGISLVGRGTKCRH